MENQKNRDIKSKLNRSQQKRRIPVAVLGAFFILLGLGNGMYFLCFPGVILVFLYFLPAIRSGYPKAFEAELARNGLTAEQAEADLAAGQEFPPLSVGARYALVFGPKIKLLPLKDLIWCYGVNTTTQYRVYGLIPAGKTRSSAIKLVSRDRSEVVSPAAEDDVKAILGAIKSRVPGVIAGYSQEVEKRMKSDFESAVRYVDSHNAGMN